MKDKFLFYIFFIICFIPTKIFSMGLEFEATDIEIINKDNILASGDVRITDDNGNSIIGNDLKIDKKEKLYSLSGDVMYENLEYLIYSDELLINENNFNYSFKKNVEIIFKNKKINLKSDEIFFNKLKNTIETNGNVIINLDDRYIIKSKNLFFNKNNEIFQSNDKSIVEDKIGNIITSENFKFLLIDNQLFASNVIMNDKDNNYFEIDKMLYDLKNEKIFAKDILINDKQDLLDQDYLPRSKSRSAIIEKDFIILKKTSYTNCKKRNECAPWSIEAKEIKHDKIKKKINYDSAKLKLFDYPIVYFPKFFTPDPSVERQSGFLTPEFSAQNSKNFTSLPYFFALSKNTDFTLTPRIYDDFKNIYQGEYREVNKNSKHILDLSVKNDNPFLFNHHSTESHLLTNSIFNLNSNYFDNSQLEINLQTTSDKKYLKNNNIKSSLLNSQSSLLSKIEFTGNSEILDLNVSTEIYEDLTKENNRYEYILPRYSLMKNLDLNLDGISELKSSGYNKNYNSNTNESIIVNDFIYTSNDIFNKNGLINNFQFNVKNFNSKSKNSDNYKNDNFNNIQGLFQYNLKLPLIKNGNYYDKSLTPKLSAKFNPTKNKNIRNVDRVLIYDDFYSLNRIANSEILEGGNSITLGNEYKITDKETNEEIFAFNLATSISDNENQDLPLKSSIGQKMSNIAGKSRLKLNNFIDIDYDFLIDNNMHDLKYHKIDASFRINNFVTSFEFVEENYEIGIESFVSNETRYDFNENNSLQFRTRRNQNTDLTEFYDLMYQYKMDCLTAGIEYKKEYYNDGSLSPSEKIYFSITIIPSETNISLPGIN